MRRQRVLDRLTNEAPVIAPSMLKCDFANLHREVELLEQAGAAVLHLDVMDGHFVPNLSYGPMVIGSLRDLTDLTFDAHLMIERPQDVLDEYLEAGCDCVTVHVEAVAEPAPLLRRIREADALAGVALNPKTPIDRIESLIGECDVVLVMSVEPGFGGQSFIPESLDKLRALAGRLPSETVLSVDGGIGPETIGPAAEAGAEMFVVGSAIFESPDYVAAIADLRRRSEHVQTSS
jgi:ribulose-phosphate 3-epimerase